MKDLLILASGFAAAAVRAGVFLLVVFRLKLAKKPGIRSAAAVFAGAAVVTVIFSRLSGMELPDFYHIITEAAWFAACVSRFQEADFRMSLFTAVFYEISVWFWQFLVAAWAGVWFHAAKFPAYHTSGGQMAAWLFYALLAAAAWYLWKHPDLSGEKAFRYVSVLVVVGFVAVITLSQQTALAVADDTLEMWTILAVILMMSVLVFRMNRQYEMEKELARLKSEQAALLERDYTALNRAYAVNAKLFHDFHNHIGALRQLLLHQKPEDALRYLDELQAPVREMTNTVWTGDDTVDYLINSKARAAEEDGVLYQAQVEFPRHTNLRSADLCAIVGNLLDNALEAARQVPENKERFVRLTVRRIHQMLVIKVENSFWVQPVEENGGLRTSKEECGLHGWGLKSAMAAAEKYDGMVQTSYAGCIFRAVATLSYQSVSV